MRKDAIYKLAMLAASHRESWDRFIANHPSGNILQSWAWGELKATSGWHPRRLALYSRATGEMVAGAQVLCRTAPHLPLRLGHLAYIPKGPILDWSQPDLYIAFFAHLDDFLRRQGALALRWEPALYEDTTEAHLLQKHLPAIHSRPVAPLQPLRTIMVDLKASEQELRGRMKEKWRYNIGLAARRGVHVRQASSLSDVRAWYDLLRVTGERDQFGIHTLTYYQRAWQLLADQGHAALFLADYEDRLLAGIFVTIYGQEAVYLYGASGNEQRNLMPNYLLQWEAMRWARLRGATRYDLWGIPATDDETEAMSGVYRFKSGWGGQVTRFVGAFERVYHPLAMSLAQHILHV